MRRAGEKEGKGENVAVTPIFSRCQSDPGSDHSAGGGLVGH
jgi:hypothetical protein